MLVSYIENEKIKVETPNSIIDLLPNLEPRPTNGLSLALINERNSELIAVESLLKPFLEIGLPVTLDRIEALAVEEQYPFVGKKLKECTPIINTSEHSVTFQSQIGPILIKPLPAGQQIGSGYSFYFKSKLEDLDSIEEILTSFYNDKEQFPYLRYTLKHDEKGHFIKYTFNSGKFKYGVIILNTNSLEKKTSPLKNAITEVINPIKRAEAEETTQLATTNKKDDINYEYNFELEKSYEDIANLIETATSLLRLGEYTIKYNGETIFKKGNVSKTFRKIESHPISIHYTGIENYPGIELFGGVLVAGLKYPLKIVSMEAIAHDTTSRNILINHFRDTLALPHLYKEPAQYIYDSGKEAKILLSIQNRGESRTKGKLIWNVVIPKEHFEKVISLIKETSSCDFVSRDLFSASLRKTHPKGYSYFVNITRS